MAWMSSETTWRSVLLRASRLSCFALLGRPSFGLVLDARWNGVARIGQHEGVGIVGRSFLRPFLGEVGLVVLLVDHEEELLLLHL